MIVPSLGFSRSSRVWTLFAIKGLRIEGPFQSQSRGLISESDSGYANVCKNYCYVQSHLRLDTLFDPVNVKFNTNLLALLALKVRQTGGLVEGTIEIRLIGPSEVDSWKR